MRSRVWVILLLLALSITVLFAYEVAFIGLLFGFHLDAISGTTLILGLLYLFILIGPWIREYISEQHLSLMIVFLLIAFAMGSYFYPWCFMNQFLGARLLQPKMYNELLPELWAPPADVLRPALAGGVAVPWGDWAISIAYWYFFVIVCALMMFSIAGIFRERWNKIEKLSYPHAVIFERVVDFALGREEKVSWLFHLGIAIGFLVYLPWILYQLLPWFPNIYGWNQPPFRYGIPSLFDLVVFSPVVKQNYAGVFTFQTSPVEVALYYIVPLDVLFTAWISWLVFLVILPQIAYTMGYYSGIPALADSYARCDLIGRQDPLKLHALAGVGMFLGVFLWPLLLNWKWYVDTLKKAFKGNPVEEIREGKIGYSFSYTLLAVTFLAAVGLMAVAGAAVYAAAWLFIAVIIHSVVMARQYAEAGVAFSGGWWGTLQALTYHVLYPGKRLEEVDRSYFEVQLMAHSLICASASSITYGPLYYSLLAYKIGEEKGLSPTQVFKGLVSALILTNIVAGPLVVFTWYAVGYSKIPVSVDGWWWPDRWTNPSLIAPYPADPPWIPHALVGLAISGIVFFLRMRYYWFPLNGIGLVFGTIGGVEGHAFPAFIAWLLKYITVKLGGAKVYEKYGVSLASGVFLGYAFAVFVLGLGTIYRFLFPY
ncbi:MAG: hypothetical protein DRN04_07810 [Thermoprotei archaeon]|nr:MAG: hypothetical protein DRN04_07810 [Thermoprotei archaeon]